MARILVVEPDNGYQEVLRDQLAAAGHEPQVVGTGDAALQEIRRSAAQVVITDWALPDMAGSELLARLRNGSGGAGLQVLVLARSLKGQVAAQALEQGADDFIARPVAGKELLARVAAALRRGPADRVQGICEVGPVRLDKPAHRVTVEGQLIELAPAEYRLMAYFMEHPDRVHNRQHLLEHVWGRRNGIGERTVDVHVRRLRALLEPHGCGKMLQTVRGFGYRFGP